ncbi:MAG: glycoside hydrolase family 31 protein [Rectinema sp.]
MKLEIKHLSTLLIRDNRAEIYGENGALLITPFQNFFHIEYKIGFSQNTIDQPVGNIARKYEAQGIHASKFDLIEEREDKIIFIRGDAKLEVVKETAVVSIYWKNRLAFGGAVGNSDTVLPKFPLRIRYESKKAENQALGEEWPAQFNFRSEPDDIFLGLGEKTGKLNKAYRRFKMFNRDALGYEPEYSDPLYISVPFYFQMSRRRSTIAGVYFPSEAAEEIDVLVESNFYTAVSMAKGPYSYTVFVGDTYREVLGQYLALTGMPALPPKFAFGFFGSSMSYTEQKDTQQKILEYFQKVEEYGIPCEGMYLSSGYIKADNGHRYTFLWNTEKFPDPKKNIQSLRNRGYRLCCNVKPGFLLDHPWYEMIKGKGYFIKNSRGEAEVEYYWGGNYASLIDFSKEAAYTWWKEQIKKVFLEFGIAGIWNDNNEFELEDDEIQETKKLPVLMAKASYEASLEVNPGKRPWIISRSGFTEIQKYSSTWTGDNVSDEKSMFLNISMGFNLGLSGIFFYGHDIGGFYGPRPEKDLLLRWCQSAVFQPRFIMHSWNPDGIPTEPWLYPEILDAIRGLIKLRYKFLPYIYSSAIRAVLESVPLEIPLWLEFFSDDALDVDSVNHLVGDALLIVPPQSVKASTVSCHFPKNTEWLSSNFATWYRGGSTIEVQYPTREPLYFFRAGSAIPFESKQSSPLEGYSDSLQVLIIPISDVSILSTVFTVYEDDGVSVLQEGSYNSFEFTQHKIENTSVQLSVTLKKHANTGPNPRMVQLSLPPGYAFYDLYSRKYLNSLHTIRFSTKGQTESVRIEKLPNS